MTLPFLLQAGIQPVSQPPTAWAKAAAGDEGQAIRAMPRSAIH
jgi:hypothetical protein